MNYALKHTATYFQRILHSDEAVIPIFTIYSKLHEVQNFNKVYFQSSRRAVRGHNSIYLNVLKHEIHTRTKVTL